MLFGKTAVNSKIAQAGAFLVALALVLTVAYAGNLLARSVWLMLEPEPRVMARVNWEIEATPQTGGAPSVQARAQEIASSHWFGEVASQQLAEQVPQPVDMPETRLQLELKGVMASGNPNQGSAMIAQRGRSGELFKVGDAVFAQAELVEIYGDRVIISRDGDLETLSFEPTEMAGGSAIASADPPRNTNGNATNEQRQAANTGRSTGAPQATQRRQRTASAPTSSAPTNGGDSAQRRLEEDLRQAITEVQSRAESDPNGLLRQYGLESTDNGYRVTPRAGILIANGLRPGDRITEINDQPVGNIDRDQELVGSVLSSDQIKITLERSGSTYRFYQSLPGF